LHLWSGSSGEEGRAAGNQRLRANQWLQANQMEAAGSQGIEFRKGAG